MVWMLRGPRAERLRRMEAVAVHMRKDEQRDWGLGMW